VRELGLGEYESSWTSHNDPSERAIEEINSLQQNSLKWREWAVKELSDVANALEEDDDNELRRKLSVVLAELAEEATPHPAIIEGRGQVVTKEQSDLYLEESQNGVIDLVDREPSLMFLQGRRYMRCPTFPPRPIFNPPPKPELMLVRYKDCEVHYVLQCDDKRFLMTQNGRLLKAELCVEIDETTGEVTTSTAKE
jgi:hypothetical protein